MNWSVWIAFWVFLPLDILLANPLPELDQLISDFNYEELKGNIKCLPDSIFYTPRNVQPECLTAALSCSFLEFTEVVRIECEDSSGIMSSTIELLEVFLKRLKTDNVQNRVNDCTCERWSQSPFSNFLANIKDLFAQLKSQRVALESV